MRAKGLAPLVEKVAQGVGAPDRGLDVNDAIGGMGVQPVEAGTAGDERALRGALGLCAGDPDPGGDLAGRAVHEYGQVGVDVEDGLLTGLAAGPVDVLTGGSGGGAGQRRGAGDRDAFGSRRPGRAGRPEGPQRGERGELQPRCAARHQVRAAAAPGGRERDACSYGDHHERRADPRHPTATPPSPRLQGPHLGDLLPGPLPVPAALGHRVRLSIERVT